ncbi:hypothetical protein [Polaribacter sp. R77954]|uniref:hypothetical protein n=1 Tax=Polaribacter sp. R77954 TaxID=3093870 RepID=UPI0037C8A7E3
MTKKKLSKRKRQEIEQKKEHKITTWFSFIFGTALLAGGLRRFFSGNISVMLHSKANYPILSNGFYPMCIGIIFLIIGIYRLFFMKKPKS